MIKKILCVFVLLLVLAILGVAVWKERQSPVPPSTISSRGGSELLILNADVDPYYLQGDSRWAAETIGGSGESIGRVGCTLCSVAMAVSDLGMEIEPPVLNQKLIEGSGYTERGWMIWGAVAPATDSFAEVVYCNEPTHRRIDECIQRGEFPIVKIFLPGPIPHWVVVVGKEGNEYLVKDPAEKSRKIVKLSDCGAHIYSLRYVRKKA